ncbi:DUF4976 domain-containing protein [Paenibacillus sp. CC-CFT747]|nr:DUF4976 domain-containing protein [Paenibacillus sp. CC-CFT747]
MGSRGYVRGPWLVSKGVTPYEEVYRIPLILAGAGVKSPGRVSSAVVSLVDLAPTIIETAELQEMDGQGRSLVPLLREEIGHEEVSAYWQEGYAEFFGQRLGYSQRLVWYDRYKYVFNGFDFDELYDLCADPDEMNNLAGLEEYEPILKAMVSRMWSRVHRLGDQSLGETHYGMFRFLPIGPNGPGETGMC